MMVTADTPAMQFSALPISDTLKTAIDDMGLTTATPVQAATLPPLLEGRDVVAKARTGTGKTVAFLVPTIERLSSTNSSSKKQIRALVLSPTRELAAQIAEAANGLVAGSGLRTVCIFGGTSMNKDKNMLKGNVDLLVATPGRLWDHMANEGLSPRLAGLQTLILDEGDRLLDQGFAKQIGDIVDRLPASRQSLCFSATMPRDLETMLGKTLRKDREVIDCVGQSTGEETASRVSQSYMSAEMNALPGLAATIVRRELDAARGTGKVIVFCPTANQAQFVSELFDRMDVPNSPLHSRKSQAFRTRVSLAFRDAPEGVLVASDVAARGVDYPDVSLVVQMGAPDNREQYVHRTGRTGRAGKTGNAMLLLSEWEERAAIGMLKGLPIDKQSAATDEPLAGVASRAADAARRVDETTRQKAYQAFLGYYKPKMRLMGWDAVKLVATANSLALGALALEEVPWLQAKTVGQMGLRGTAGLNVLKGPSGAPRGRDTSDRPYSGGRGTMSSRGGGGRSGGGGGGRGRGRGLRGGGAPRGGGGGGRGRGGRGGRGSGPARDRPRY